MITVDIRPARTRWGRKSRCRWQLRILDPRGFPLDPRETYDNVRTIKEILEAFRTGDVKVRVTPACGVRIEMMEGRASGSNYVIRPPL